MLGVFGKFAGLALLCVAAAVPPTSLAESVTTRGTSLCHIGLGDRQIPDRCFPPSKIALVESKMPVKPVRPVASVARVAHLNPVELELRNPRQPIAIQYLFGRVGVGLQGFPDLRSHASRYVIVEELVGHSGVSAPRLFRYRTPTGTTAYVEWDANLHCHDLGLSVVSNLQGRVVQALGRSILGAEICKDADRAREAAERKVSKG
jgi:hypothetical protein